MFKVRKTITFLCFIVCVSSSIRAQEIYQPITSSVYEYLDEMASLKIIQLITVTKPYSRKLIAQKLQDIGKNKEELNARQLDELSFYLKDFGKEIHPNKDFKKRIDLFYYKDSLFTFSINPILGYQIEVNSNGSYSHRWNGAEGFGYVGDHFGFYFSLRDNGVSRVLAGDEHLTTMIGAKYKLSQGDSTKRSDYSEMRGGITYSWKWGSIGLIKDYFVWGNNYRSSNIFSGRQPSFSYINLSMQPVSWLRLQYIHGWLASDVIDSSKTYGNVSKGGKRTINHGKFLATNLVTLSPWKYLDFSLGNSVIYSDIGVHPGYLIPVFFYKSVDHQLNGAGSNSLGQNSQMFLDISSKQIKHFHLFTTIFIDEISIGKMWDKAKHTNMYSAFGLTYTFGRSADEYDYDRTESEAASGGGGTKKRGLFGGLFGGKRTTARSGDDELLNLRLKLFETQLKPFEMQYLFEEGTLEPPPPRPDKEK